MKRSVFFKMALAAVCVVAAVSCHSSSSSTTEIITDDRGCADAPPVRLTGQSFQDSGKLDHILDAAYYRFAVPAAGSWLLFETGNEQISESAFDPVISILSADGNELRASMNDSLAWSSIDPYMMYHAPDVEQICIKIESFQRWTESTIAVDSTAYDLAYNFRMTHHPSETDTYDVGGSAPNDTIEQSTPVALFEPAEGNEGQLFSWVHGTVDSASDVDVFSFTTGGAVSLTDVYLNTREGVGVPRAGISGSGTTAMVWAEILNDTAQVVAAVHLNERRVSLSAVLDAESMYYLRISGAEGWISGKNDYYSFLMVSDPVENSNFESTTENGSIQSAEPIVQEESSEMVSYGTVLGAIDTPTDVDFFTVDVAANQYLFLQCMGASLGSGLNDFTVGVLDASGTVIQSDTEGEVPIEWSDGSTGTSGFVTISQAGKYYFKVEGTPVDSPHSNLYFCYLAFIDASL